jgi:ribonucleoside-diphosphate reductase alpha chain
MPTASTSQILGNTESIEMITSNLYKRNTLSGEFIVINKYLVEDLLSLGLWNDNIRQKIMASNGSVQNIEEIPQRVKDLYKTVWETSQKVIIDMSADRAPFICQTQSLNIHMKDVNFSKLTTALFKAWKLGLKTGSYYIRQQSASEAAKFTVDKSIENKVKQEELERAVKKLKELGTDDQTINSMMDDPTTLIEAAKGACSTKDPGSCDMCSG